MFKSAKAKIENYAGAHKHRELKNWASIGIAFMQMSLNLQLLIYVNIYQD